ncbi:TPA: hypothetical protein MI542_28235, partial [Klebsiella pneumoniae]|nr:hypothetical protein [Klebsiella pneumoniae]
MSCLLRAGVPRFGPLCHAIGPLCHAIGPLCHALGVVGPFF